MQEALQHVNVAGRDPRELNPNLDSEAAEILLRGIARDPNERIGSMKDFAESLRRLEAKVPQSRVQPRDWAGRWRGNPLRKWSRRRARPLPRPVPREPWGGEKESTKGRSSWCLCRWNQRVSFYPDLETFASLASTYNMVPVYRQLTSDSLTPVSAFSRIDDGGWSFLFESVVGGEKVGRYSFLGVQPFLTFQSFGKRITVEGSDGKRTYEHDQPFDELDRLIQRFKAPHLAGLPRFHGGAVGYAAYDAIRYIEYLPNVPTDDRNIPDLSFAFFDQMVVFDNIRKVVLVVALAHTGAGDAKESYQKACERVDAMVELLRRPKQDLLPVDIDTTTPAMPAEIKSNFTKEKFIASVEKCKEYIRAGDFFQIVISQRFETETTASPLEIYRSLRVVNPSPFMVYLKDPNCTLVASSPEIMVRVENGKIVSRPLAGRGGAARMTRKTGDWRRSFWPTPRSGPSTSCWSIWVETTSGGFRSSARFGWTT